MALPAMMQMMRDQQAPPATGPSMSLPPGLMSYLSTINPELAARLQGGPNFGQGTQPAAPQPTMAQPAQPGGMPDDIRAEIVRRLGLVNHATTDASQANQTADDAWAKLSGMQAPSPHHQNGLLPILGTLLFALAGGPKQQAGTAFAGGFQQGEAQKNQEAQQQYGEQKQNAQFTAQEASRKADRASKMLDYYQSIYDQAVARGDKDTANRAEDAYRQAKLAQDAAEGAADRKSRETISANNVTGKQVTEWQRALRDPKSTAEARMDAIDGLEASGVRRFTPEERDRLSKPTYVQTGAEAKAGLDKSKMATEDQTRAGKVAVLGARAKDLLEGAALKGERKLQIAEAIKFMPEQEQIKVAKANAEIANLQNLTQYRGASLAQQDKNQAQQNIRAGMDSFKSQADTLRVQLRTIQSQYNKLDPKDPDRKNMDEQAKIVQNQIVGLQQERATLEKGLKTVDSIPTIGMDPMNPNAFNMVGQGAPPGTQQIGGSSVGTDNGVGGKLVKTPFGMRDMNKDRTEGIAQIKAHPDKADAIRKKFFTAYGQNL